MNIMSESATLKTEEMNTSIFHFSLFLNKYFLLKATSIYIIIKRFM